jgi:hypothetical protein
MIFYYKISPSLPVGNYALTYDLRGLPTFTFKVLKSSSTMSVCSANVGNVPLIKRICVKVFGLRQYDIKRVHENYARKALGSSFDSQMQVHTPLKRSDIMLDDATVFQLSRAFVRKLAAGLISWLSPKI